MESDGTGTIVFAGDSITEAERDNSPGSLGRGYVRMVANELPGMRVVNVGVGGRRARNVRQHWDAEILDQTPVLASVLIGVNDTRHRYTQHETTSAPSYRSDLDAIVRMSLSRNVEIVIMEHFILPLSDEIARWRAEDLEEKIEVARAVAREHNVLFVPLDDALRREATVEGTESVAPDGIHPTERGHRLIAERWLEVVLPRLKKELSMNQKNR
ncbi:SGNH/GDSL hydrolase family protein [Humibacter ginsenosidimutans]|nr:GDSL-type esterase/lipase family protein [Humibacter ginsenosidimutans]